jgi:hypothetical protein
MADTVDEHLIPSTMIEADRNADDIHHWLPEDRRLRETLRQITVQWTEHAEPGWPKVQAVVQRLRTDFVHQSKPAAKMTAVPDIVDFLTEVKQGPDYVFATSCALLLRELGFATRLMVGYYASPARFDVWSRLTPISVNDVHTWAEMKVGQTWVPIEPTPGYDLLPPQRSYWSATLAVLESMKTWMIDRPATLAGIGTVFLMMFIYRLRLMDWIRTAIWRASLFIHPNRSLVWTICLLDHRLRLAGLPRPNSFSPRRWFRGFEINGRCETVLSRFLDQFDVYVYSEHLGQSSREIKQSCHDVVRHWTLRRLCTFRDKRKPLTNIWETMAHQRVPFMRRIPQHL